MKMIFNKHYIQLFIIVNTKIITRIVQIAQEYISNSLKWKNEKNGVRYDKIKYDKIKHMEG
jgi:hypothetical protein